MQVLCESYVPFPVILRISSRNFYNTAGEIKRVTPLLGALNPLTRNEDGRCRSHLNLLSDLNAVLFRARTPGLLDGGLASILGMVRSSSVV